MTRYLWNKLAQWRAERPISTHVPGHKNGTIGDLEYVDGTYDITEITGFDDLHHPEEVLRQSMNSINKHEDYDAFYLVNGTTSGILAVVHAFSAIAGNICMARNVHKSVFNALDLANQEADMMSTEISPTTYQYFNPQWHSMDHRNHKLAIATYPNYYGELFDVKQLIDHFHDQDIPVFIDEAHGAHFGLSGFPKSSMSYGADYVVQSYHKTLPSLTMSSVLFIHKNAPYRDQVIHLLQTFQSSSPSYLLMASLEQAHHFYSHYQSAHFFNKREQLLHRLVQCGYEVETMDDPLKFVIRCKGYSGEALQALMESQSIFVELSDTYSVLWILPLWYLNDRYPFEALMERLTHIRVTPHQPQSHVDVPPLYTKKGKYQGALCQSIKDVHYQHAKGLKLAEHLVPYPPGIPVMYKGEIVTQDMIELIGYWCEQHLRVEGLRHHYIKVEDDE